jgi:hypothetical protein
VAHVFQEVTKRGREGDDAGAVTEPDFDAGMGRGRTKGDYDALTAEDF